MDKALFNQMMATYHHVQEHEEFYWLISEVEKLNPHIIVEVGVHHGGSLKFWETILSPGDLLIGIDYEPQLYWDVSKSDRRVVIVRGRSESEETLSKVKEILAGRKADFIFLDGSHSYSVVRVDFEDYGTLLRDGGIVAIHDISTEWGEAGRFFAELEAMYPNATAKMCRVQGTGIWWKHG